MHAVSVAGQVKLYYKTTLLNGTLTTDPAAPQPYISFAEKVKTGYKAMLTVKPPASHSLLLTN